MQAIGIDLGTTSICGVVLDAESGRVVKTVTKNSNAFLAGVGEWEKIQDAGKILGIALEIVDSFITDETSVIGVTGQMHGIVYTDADGEPVSPLYTWQDGRGRLAYKDTTYADFLGSFTGYGNVTDFYNRTNGIRPKSAVSYCTIHDLLVMRLCKLTKPFIHASDAASFGLYDLERKCFSYDYSPVITEKCEIAGCYKGIPVSVAVGDNQASVFSAVREGDILLNFGTGSQVSAVSDRIVKGENIETRPYFEGKYLSVGAALCGGRAYSMLRDFYASVLGYARGTDPDEVYAIMDRMLESASPSALSADTRFAGTRADSTVTGSITGISTENLTPGNLTYAFLCGMVQELYGMYQQMGITHSGIVGSGNGIRKNPALVKIAEKKFGARMKIPAHTEEAAVGAAMLGLVANGAFKSCAQVQKLIKYL